MTRFSTALSFPSSIHTFWTTAWENKVGADAIMLIRGDDHSGSEQDRSKVKPPLREDWDWVAVHSESSNTTWSTCWEPIEFFFQLGCSTSVKRVKKGVDVIRGETNHQESYVTSSSDNLSPSRVSWIDVWRMGRVRRQARVRATICIRFGKDCQWCDISLINGLPEELTWGSSGESGAGLSLSRP